MTREGETNKPKYRYDARLANKIELKWQQRWLTNGTYNTPNPSGTLTDGYIKGTDRSKLFVMDMFPYPSSSGLHVGHPLGFIGTDVYARFKRMQGVNVLHTMGFDAFGLPAEEHARSTGTHPRDNTNSNIATYRRQLSRLGLGHDPRRSVCTTDPDYYRWTQWIFLQIFNSWYDPELDCARPISELEAAFQNGDRSTPDGRPYIELSKTERRTLINDYRLAYLGEAPVNWCPGLGTVLANEEITAEGRSERGNHPVFRRPLKQWMMRITAFSDRLLSDLDALDWSDSIKTMQRNWIGRSEGATVSFKTTGPAIEVFTTRPDTLFGVTYMVLAPEHPLVDALTADVWPDETPRKWTGGSPTPAAAVATYRQITSQKSEIDRQENKEKTGVFIGAFATVPVNNKQVPIFVADYVLLGYGTGAVMAVPGQDQRDWEFAKIYDLEIIRTVEPPEDFCGEAFTGEGPAINSDFLDGLEIKESKRSITTWLTENHYGEKKVTYKLRDWLFSRQRYWGEPFPIVYADDGEPQALPENELPIELPELIDWAPRELDVDSDPEPPLGRAAEWATTQIDLGDGRNTFRRELNTMPQWAGSCWYYLRYLDPKNDAVLVDPEVERYWMKDPEGGIGGVDLYVGGVEHAVLHLLYARFWHKVLFDLGHVSGPEPFQRLFNQGYIQAYAFTDNRGMYVEAEEVEAIDGSYIHKGEPVNRVYGKMGKSLKNSVTPDEMYSDYGADTLRIHEMFMGPLDQDRPWDTTAVIGSHRLLQRIWRNIVNEETGELRTTEKSASTDLKHRLQSTISAVTEDMNNLQFNTAIARITELNNELTRLADGAPREIAEPLVQMIAPLAPHLAEELWERLGHSRTIVYEPFPIPDETLLTTKSIEIPIQVNGKLRTRITVSADIDEDSLRQAALSDSKIQAILGSSVPHNVIVVPSKLVNVVT